MDQEIKLEGQKLESQLKLENELLANPLVTDYFSVNFGENSVKVIKAAMEEMTDDAIAARCKLKVAEVRAILNKLYNYKLAEYKRIKDRDTGWFSYLWKIDVSNVLSVIQIQINSKIDELDQKVEKMNTDLLYYCPNCSKTNLIQFDLAMDLSFRCPHCEHKLIEKEIEEKEAYQDELKDLREKHSILIEDIKKFEEMRKIEEEHLKAMRAQIAEQTMIQAIADSKDVKAKKVALRKAKQAKKAKLAKNMFKVKQKHVKPMKFKFSKKIKITSKKLKVSSKKIRPSSNKAKIKLSEKASKRKAKRRSR